MLFNKMDLSFVITCLFLFVGKVETQSGSVDITSKTSWQVGSNVTIECSFTDGPGQTLKKISFGIIEPPQKTEDFITVFASSGSIVDSTPWPSKWTWYKGRVSWVGDLDSKKAAFRLTKAALNDSRTFYCTVTWSGNFNSIMATTTILITAPPTVIKPTVSSYYIKGNQVSVTCNTTGVPTPTVHWIRMIDTYKYQTFNGSSHLRFDPVDKGDAGQYKCIATNSVGSDEDTVDIVVYYKPETTILLSNATRSVAVTGEYILLTCKVPEGAAKPQVIKYRFYYASKMLQNSSSGEYVIANIQLADKGRYKCVASNLAGDGTEVFMNLTVHEPVKIISPLNYEVITRIKGEAVPLVCVAAGYPSPKVTWTKDGESFGINNNATIVKSTRDDAGTYKCTATNGVKEPKSVTITVRIFYEPEIIVGETNSTVASWNGNTLTLQCVAKGEPPAEFQWYKPGGQQITSNIFTIKDASTVTIKTTTAPGDYGKYKCRASNAAGFNEHNITVIQWVKPGKPNITDPDIETSYIKLKWTPPSNSGGSQVIDYKVTVSGDNQQRIIPPITGTHTYIRKLKPGWSYTFVLSARNVVGYSESVSRTFKTKFKGKPGLSTIKNNETEISSKQFTLTWSAAPKNGAKILTYTVWWRQIDSTGGIGGWSWSNTSSDKLSFTVTLLEFGKTYDFGVTAWNLYGEGPRDDENGLKRIKVVQKSTKTLPTKEPERSTGVNAAAIGGGAAAAVVIILLVIIVIVIIKRKKSPKKGESRDPLGSNGDEGYSSVSKASAARRLGRNNAANDDAGIPTYATVDKSKKTPKKPDLIYAELADFNETPEARAASMKRQNQPSSYVPTDYAEITQFGRPKEEPMYDNVPRY